MKAPSIEAQRLAIPKTLLGWLKFANVRNEKSDSAISRSASRCCGRCDGTDDICVADMICDKHFELGCLKCWPDPE